MSVEPGLTSSQISEHGVETELRGGPIPESQRKRGRGMGPRHLSGSVLAVLSSALLYLSFFLSILAPVPLLWVRLVRGRWAAMGATVLNGALVFALSGWPGLAGYFVFAVATAWGLAEISLVLASRSARRSVGVERRLFWLLSGSALGVAVALGGAVFAWARVAQISPWAELLRGLDWLGAQMIAQAPAGTMDAADWAVQRDQWIRNLPSSLAIAMLLQCWMAMTLIFRINPARIRERLGVSASFHRLWRNPEGLVWPTLAAGFGVLVLHGAAADAASNLLKVLLAFYGLQGLAILGGVFDLWRLRGFGRAAAFFLVFTLMLPLVLALGFFDLWFDFRAKFRQS